MERKTKKEEIQEKLKRGILEEVKRKRKLQRVTRS